MSYARLIAFVLILSSFGIAYAFMPPVYIANPDTGECNYYFAGDGTHYNPAPNGTWEMIGMSGQNSSYCQKACFLNTNFFWEGVIEVTHSNTTLSDLPLDYRIFTNLSCACIDDGAASCQKWCDINGGFISDLSSNNYQCSCLLGGWRPGEGCQSVVPFIVIALLAFLIAWKMRTDASKGYNKGSE